MRRLTVAFGTLGLVALVVAHGGCSSSSSSSSSPAACSVAPTPPAQDSFCTAMAGFDARCGHCDDCTAKNLQNCTKVGTTVSDAYRAAFVSCKDSVPCDKDPRVNDCVENALATATPTAAQLQAKTAYCNACNATNAADCTDFFSVGVIGKKNGPGLNILVYGDAVATMAATRCSADCDPFTYAVCVALVSCGPAGGDYCQDAGLCTGH